MTNPHPNKDLLPLWHRYVKCPMPTLRRPLLIRYINWYKQAQQGKIDLDKFFRALEKASLSTAATHQQTAKKKEFILETGTKIIRSYKGVRYEIEVINGGYLYRSNVYKSLSAIARLITGKQWNGKIFFGVKK